MLVVVDMVKKVAEVWDSLCESGLTARRIDEISKLVITNGNMLKILHLMYTPIDTLFGQLIDKFICS